MPPSLRHACEDALPGFLATPWRQQAWRQGKQHIASKVVDIVCVCLWGVIVVKIGYSIYGYMLKSCCSYPAILAISFIGCRIGSASTLTTPRPAILKRRSRPRIKDESLQITWVDKSVDYPSTLGWFYNINTHPFSRLWFPNVIYPRFSKDCPTRSELCPESPVGWTTPTKLFAEIRVTHSTWGADGADGGLCWFQMKAQNAKPLNPEEAEHPCWNSELLRSKSKSW